MVTVFGLWSQLVWKVLTAQPYVEARWHSNHCELFPTAGDKKSDRLPRKLVLPANIVELINKPMKKAYSTYYWLLALVIIAMIIMIIIIIIIIIITNQSKQKNLKKGKEKQSDA